MAKITVRHLTKTYNSNTGKVTALEDISFEVQPYESLCILGPSGCGKTTLLRLLDCLIARDHGEILLDGEPVTLPRSDVAMVFQHFGLFPWKNLEQNIAYGLTLRGCPREEITQTVQRYIGLVGLKGFERSYPYQLSGGMQQRAGLARALAVNPSLLLMDEPFGSLDAQTRETLQEELSRILAHERKTVLFVTHSIDEAIYLGDRILLMTPRPGRIREILPVEIARPRDISRVRSDPRSVRLRAYIWDQLKERAAN
ncbi:MAG TPA: ABC transporter ATP-binding protein [Candidatus Binatia bacterium]|nr:ABC transporter ATP-binding protein [Candidatus Binatia bacterium]